MHGSVELLKQPGDCNEEERRAFERLVRAAFDGSDDGLPERIRRARWLAFQYVRRDGHQEGSAPVAIAGLKAPDAAYRDDVFHRAGADGIDPDRYPFELGWVVVQVDHRGQRRGARLCRRLLARAPGCGVFATTRPDNHAMIKTLAALGFARTGRPYRHVRRDEELVLFLRRADFADGTGAL